MSWLPPLRKHLFREETTASVTGTTHEDPKLRELDPSDPAVVALTSSVDEESLPPVPVRSRGW